MIDVIGRLPSGSKSGLTHFMFGSAASLNRNDVILIAIVAALSVGILSLFYQQFVATSFDVGFSRSIGIPVQLFHYTLMLLLAFSVVVALQAVGVVLVSAMLIIPAAAAYLLCDRMHRMIGTAAVIGGLSAFLGHFVSFLNHKLPSGPFIVLSSSLLFVLAFLFSPRYGIVRRWLHFRGHGRRIKRENTMKAIYHILERDKFVSEHVEIDALAKQRRCDSAQIDREIRALEKKGLATRNGGITLTPSGYVRACEIVRNHRLWELYLTNAANIAPDHVHEDAEKIEHVLGERVVREIERQLDDATKDPHGRLIPSLEDMTRGAIGGLMDDRAKTGNPGGFSPQN